MSFQNLVGETVYLLNGTGNEMKGVVLIVECRVLSVVDGKDGKPALVCKETADNIFGDNTGWLIPREEEGKLWFRDREEANQMKKNYGEYLMRLNHLMDLAKDYQYKAELERERMEEGQECSLEDGMIRTEKGVVGPDAVPGTIVTFYPDAICSYTSLGTQVTATVRIPDLWDGMWKLSARFLDDERLFEVELQMEDAPEDGVQCKMEYDSLLEGLLGKPASMDYQHTEYAYPWGTITVSNTNGCCIGITYVTGL